MRLSAWVAVAVVVSATAIGARAETDDLSARLAAAHALLVASHQSQLDAERIDLIVDASVNQLKQATPNLSDDDRKHYGAVLREELERDVAQLEDLRARYYADHFSADDLQAWTKLLESNVGQKILGASPQMMRDFYSVDTQWVTDATQRAVNRMGNASENGAKPL